MFLRYINSASTDREAATVASTKTNQASTFKGCCSFLLSIEIINIYIEELSKFQQNIFISSFTQAMQETTFTRRNKYELVEGTVSATLSHVSQAFRSKNRADPRLDADGKNALSSNNSSEDIAIKMTPS